MSQQRTVQFSGKLLTINPFKQLVIKCDNPEKLTPFEQHGHVPWVVNDDGDVICKVKIPSWKQSDAQLQRYDDMKGAVTVACVVKPYDFVKDEVVRKELHSR